MDLGIEGRAAAVAAASGGLGFASAKALVDAGCRVAICGRDQRRISTAADELGRGAVAITQDVSGLVGGRRFVSAATEKLGPIDILVANAGGPPVGGFFDVPEGAYQEALELNLLSVVGMCQEAIPYMRRQKFGRVVAITSLSVRQPIGSLLLSNTARAGATGFLKSLAREVAADGVTVNSVQPGIHRTGRLEDFSAAELDQMAQDVPAGFLGDPSDFGQVVAFLCSASARYITGAALQIDGGAYSGLQ